MENIISKNSSKEKEKMSNLKNSLVMLDTCALIHGNLEGFWTKSAPILRKENARIIIPLCCILEIKKQIKCNCDPNIVGLAKLALLSIKKHIHNQEAEIFGDSSDDTFADGVLLWIFQKLVLRYSLILITQDRKLAADICAINRQSSRHHNHKVEAMKLLPNGTLSCKYA